MPLHFEGYGQGEPLVLLHGLFGSLENWHSISRRLGERFRVLAVDLPNHGRSPRAAVMTFRTMAEDVVGLLHSQSISRAHIMGHSLGGKVAMQLALSHPANVRDLVVVDISPRAFPGRHESLLTALQALDLTTFSQRGQLEQALARDIPDLATRRFLLKNVVRDAQGNFQWRIGLKELRANYASLTDAVANGRPFTGEALFLRGEHSDYLVPADFEQIERLFPRARLHMLPGTGHLPHVENPQALLEELMAFLGHTSGSEI